MTGKTAAGFPSIVLLAGIISGVVWVIGLDYTYALTGASLLRLITTALLAAVGSSLAALMLNVVSKPDQDKLDQVEHDSKHDDLTGLVNRGELFRVLGDSLEQSQRDEMVLGLLFLDLDRFKQVNDSMGHEVGDELLRIVAERLKSSVRNTDVVARFGGDEFVVLCRDLLSGESVVSTARQILKAFSDPVLLNGKDHRISTSIGVVVVNPDESRPGDVIIRDADAAMYRAKETKTGFAVFDEEAQRMRVMNRLDVERELLQALNKQEFVVMYQPIVDASNRSLYGFEALVRWDHPERGLLGPGEFLHVAEDLGLMAPIGELVLREACAQAGVWNHIAPSGRSVLMGVNLSEQQLVDNGLPDLVAGVLSWAGLEPQQLVLEITEDVIIDHLEGLNSLRDLRDQGVSLAIDDFGTGQSGLSYIKQFDMVSTLKIDQCFVRDMRNASADRAIIEAVVAMASALDLRVVAEGVEYEDQAAQLRELGVDLMQGFLFTAPVTPDLVDPKSWFPAQNSGVRGTGLKSDDVKKILTRAKTEPA